MDSFSSQNVDHHSHAQTLVDECVDQLLEAHRVACRIPDPVLVSILKFALLHISMTYAPDDDTDNE